MASFITAGNATNGLQVSSDNTGILELRTGTGSGTTAVTFSTGQRATFPSTISVGNTTPATTGAGITFPAAQSASSDANTLDDYEEGTFTPNIVGSSTNGTVTYGAERSGKYTKIGNVVYIHINISWSSGTGTGSLRISGLPFTSANETYVYPAITIAYSHNVANSANNVQTSSVLPNSAAIQFEQYPVGGGAATSIAYDAAGQYSLGGFYFV